MHRSITSYYGMLWTVWMPVYFIICSIIKSWSDIKTVWTWAIFIFFWHCCWWILAAFKSFHLHKLQWGLWEFLLMISLVCKRTWCFSAVQTETMSVDWQHTSTPQLTSALTCFTLLKLASHVVHILPLPTSSLMLFQEILVVIPAQLNSTIYLILWK